MFHHTEHAIWWGRRALFFALCATTFVGLSVFARGVSVAIPSRQSAPSSLSALLGCLRNPREATLEIDIRECSCFSCSEIVLQVLLGPRSALLTGRWPAYGASDVAPIARKAAKEMIVQVIGAAEAGRAPTVLRNTDLRARPTLEMLTLSWRCGTERSLPVIGSLDVVAKRSYSQALDVVRIVHAAGERYLVLPDALLLRR